MIKIKIIAIVVAALLVGGTGVALAAAGHIPDSVKTLVGAGDEKSVSTDAYEDGASNDQYENRVDDAARDKEVTGTKTLPNGKEVENHGQGVSTTARAQQDDSADDNRAAIEPGEDSSDSGTRTKSNEDSSDNGTRTESDQDSREDNSREDEASNHASTQSDDNQRTRSQDSGNR